MSRLVDELLSRASIAKQRIDTYTGTDYTSIEALRKRIEQQEKKIEDSHSGVQEARFRYQGEISKQTSAQKEIVSLLERKSSWLPTDLERYMTLVRSEHVNDQSVQTAKLALDTSERDLEDARTQLQKLVGQEYHEEHIWSETIRRNNTWLTFGLMGVNILLLLAQIVVFEPYRRHKIVSELKEALDEKALTTVVAAPGADLLAQSHLAESPIEKIMEENDATMQISSVDVGTQTLEFVPPSKESLEPTELSPGQLLPEEAVYYSQEIEKAQREPARLWTLRSSWAAYQSAFWDLFSDRLIEMRQLDATTLAIRSVAFGVAVTGLVASMLRQYGFNT